MPMQKSCDKCREEVVRFRFLKKIGKKRYCKKCAKDIRIKNRKNLIESDDDLKNDLRELKNKEVRNYNARKKAPVVEEDFPKIKGSKKTIKKKSEAYLTFYEKQVLLKTLISRGLEFEDAKERINDLVKEQKKIRIIMKQQGKDQEEIKIKQRELIEQLWR